MGIYIFAELLTTFLYLRIESFKSALNYMILENIIAIFFIVAVGLSYIICKTDYMKKLEKQRINEEARK